MLLLFAILNVYDLVAAFPTQDINIDQYNSFGTTIGPIFDKNMRSLNIENLTSDYGHIFIEIPIDSWDNKNFDVFLMSVPGLKPFVILRETADEKMTKVDGDEEDAFKVEEQNPRVDFNKIKYFSKSYHLGRINKQLGTHLDRI